MKKTWIMIKRGLITDPSHRERMGECLWLFQYMLDRADWETGKVYGWKDRHAADEMHMPIATIRHQRRKLESENYIQSEQNQHSLTISILKYVSPPNINRGPTDKSRSADEKSEASDRPVLSDFEKAVRNGL